MECLQLKTCLSPKVHFLIVEAGRSRKKMEEGVSCLTSEGFIHWEQARCYLSEMTITDGYDYFLSCVESLSPVFFEVEEHLLSKQQEEIWMKHKIYLEWIPEPHLSAVEDSLNFLNSPNPSHHILALQLMSSILERTLGDVFENESSSQCPSLLKDILNSEEINQVFGKHVVQILRGLMGPPTSLNLRNVVWHGFPNIGEIPRRYGCFLYLTLPSLGKILDEKRKGIQTHRQLMKLSLNVGNTCDIPDLIPQIPLVKELIEVTQPFHSRQALLQCSLELMAERRYSYAVALLLPQLEHILRLMFVSVNNCSERVLTAESDTLYTTLDEIFEKYLPNGDVNKISEALGDSLMDLLFDLMIYPEGPRVRDKVSHGEANLQDIPESLALAVLVAVVMVMWKCSKFTTSNENELIKDLAIFESRYCSAFHPMSIIKQKIIQIVDIVAKLPDAMQYDETLSLKVLSPTFELCQEDREMFEEIQSVTEDLVLFICQDWDIQLTPEEINKCLFQVFSDGKAMIKLCLKEKLSTLYRFSANQQISQAFNSHISGRTGACLAEIAGLLTRVLTELECMIVQVLSALRSRQEQLEKRLLRSRQRDNLVHLIRGCPFFHHCVHFVLLVCCWKLLTLNKQTGPKLLRFLKQLLKFIENLRTFTSSDKNKWTECVSLYREFIPKVKVTLSDLKNTPTSRK